MSNIEARGSKARDSPDWNHPWSVVSQLAAARGTTLREVGEDRSPSILGARSEPAAISPASFAPIAPDQLAHDIAEIERAAAALRRGGAGPPRRPPPPTIWPKASGPPRRGGGRSRPSHAARPTRRPAASRGHRARSGWW